MKNIKLLIAFTLLSSNVNAQHPHFYFDIPKYVDLPISEVLPTAPKAEFDWYAIQNFDWGRYEYDESRISLPGYVNPHLWAYNPETHSYGSGYTHPLGYRILLDGRKSFALRADIKYHWKVEHVSFSPGLFGREVLRNVYENTFIHPMLSLTTFPVMYRYTSRSPDDAHLVPNDSTFIPIPTGPMLPSQGVYKITLELIEASENRVIASKTDYIRIKDFVIVIIGDSNASGEGNPIRPGSGGGTDLTHGDFWDECETPVFSKLSEEIPDWLGSDWLSSIECHSQAMWLDKLGNRSTNSGHFLAAVKLAQNKHLFVTLLSFAKSGASIDKGILNPQFPEKIRFGQLEEVKNALSGRAIDILLISQGINELDFEDYLSHLVKHNVLSAYILSEDYGADDGPTVDMRRKLWSVVEKYSEMGRRIKLELPYNGMKVYVTEYPFGIFNNNNGEVNPGCGLFGSFFTGVTKTEAELTNDINLQLNNYVRRAANELGWNYISEIAEAFKTHGYCASNPYFITASQSCRKQCNWRGTMHPNSEGHLVISDIIYQRLLNDIKELKFKHTPLDL